MRVSVELCAASMEDVHLARELDLDSVELCSWLACGGVTPGMGFIRTAMQVADMPLRVLVRPHGGGFHYSAAEVQVMRADVAALPGMAHPVVGMLDAQGMPDLSAFREVIGTASMSNSTFHRALDHCPQPLQALEMLLNEGVGRVLTSGGSTLAVDGLPLLRSLVQQAGTRLQVAVAGGVGPANVLRIVEATGATEVHFAAQLADATPQGLASMSSAHSTAGFATRPDRAKVEGVLETLSKAGLR